MENTIDQENTKWKILLIKKIQNGKYLSSGNV